MGALTTNRKRNSEYFKLISPSPPLNSSYNNSNYYYFNQIHNHISKKPRVSYCETPGKVIATRLSKYPEPDKLKREVHGPCSSGRVGLFPGRSMVQRSGIRETAAKMGNALHLTYNHFRDVALNSFRFFKGKEVIDVVDNSSYKEYRVSKVSKGLKDLGVLENVEDGNEVKLVVSEDCRVVENNGLDLEKGSVSDLVDVEDARKSLGSMSIDREGYKGLWRNVEQKFSPKLSNLDFNIKLEEARLQSIRLERRKEEKKPAEVEEPKEDLVYELFLPLTEEEEREVTRAMSTSNRRKILVTHESSNIEITAEILRCLRPGAWLNDEVINLYLELLKERETREPKKFLKCHFFNTFFYKKLIGGRNGYDYKAVRRWTSQRKLGYELVNCDKIFVPVHKEVHWCLAVINKRDKSLQYLDSLGGRDQHVLRALARYIVDEVKDKSGQEIDLSSWDQEFVEDLPEQQNGFDCGVFMIKYIDFYSRGLGLHFSQENMPYFRRRTARDILRLRAD